MEVHDALDIALHDLARGVAEGGDEAGHEAEHGEPTEDADGHQPSSTNSKVEHADHEIDEIGCGIGSWGFLEGRCLRMADHVRGPEGDLGGDRRVPTC